MDLSRHITTVRDGIDSALSFADDDTKQLASKVASAAEPSLRLALIDAVTEAADEINDGLDENHVTVAFVDGDPRFVVQARPYSTDEADGGFDDTDDVFDGVIDDEFEDDEIEGDEIEGDDLEDDELEDDDADETLVRFSLRLPKWAKDKVDERAEHRGMSTNAYLTEVIISEIAGARGPRGFGGFGGPSGGPKGWGPGGLLGPDAAEHIARMLSDVFGEDAGRRGGRGGAGRPGGGRPRSGGRSGQDSWGRDAWGRDDRGGGRRDGGRGGEGRGAGHRHGRGPGSGGHGHGPGGHGSGGRGAGGHGG